MHISEGILSAPVLLSGGIIAAVGIAIGLRKLQNIPLCGILSAAFFIASLIHVPVGFGNAHLLLTGLCGILLGWSAFPAIFTALALQALLFQYGGLTTLGINTASMGGAAVLSWCIFHLFLAHWPRALNVAAFMGGFLGIALSALFTSFALAFSNEGFQKAAYALFFAHLPVMVAEGFITMLTLHFLLRIRPNLFTQELC